tara:strand:- start:43 stop:363 length:321 start_codon:yes stop_codon:yes gene_type:complete
MVYQMIKNKQRNTTKQQYEVQGDYLYRIILFFLLGWVISSVIINCTQAPPIDVPIKTYELVGQLGTVHIYKEEPLVGKAYYCTVHKYPEVIYLVNDSKRVRRWSGI